MVHCVRFGAPTPGLLKCLTDDVGLVKYKALRPLWCSSASVVKMVDRRRWFSKVRPRPELNSWCVCRAQYIRSTQDLNCADRVCGAHLVSAHAHSWLCNGFKQANQSEPRGS